jgi:hypothetical protein
MLAEEGGTTITVRYVLSVSEHVAQDLMMALLPGPLGVL